MPTRLRGELNRVLLLPTATSVRIRRWRRVVLTLVDHLIPS